MQGTWSPSGISCPLQLQAPGRELWGDWGTFLPHLFWPRAPVLKQFSTSTVRSQLWNEWTGRCLPPAMESYKAQEPQNLATPRNCSQRPHSALLHPRPAGSTMPSGARLALGSGRPAATSFVLAPGRKLARGKAEGEVTEPGRQVGCPGVPQVQPQHHEITGSEKQHP